MKTDHVMYYVEYVCVCHLLVEAGMHNFVSSGQEWTDIK